MTTLFSIRELYLVFRRILYCLELILVIRLKCIWDCTYDTLTVADDDFGLKVIMNLALLKSIMFFFKAKFCRLSYSTTVVNLFHRQTLSVFYKLKLSQTNSSLSAYHLNFCRTVKQKRMARV